jgi:hypothetical protein
MNTNDANRRKRIIRTALILAAIAIAFYASFILMGVGRA